MISDLKPYPIYRKSGEAWLESIPAHWEVQSLGSLVSSISERNRADLPLLSVVREKGVILRSSMREDENHNFIPDDLTNYKIVRVGDLVINKMKAWQGSLGVSAFDGIVSPAYLVFRLEVADREFAHRLLRSKPYVAYFAKASDGVRIGQWDLSISGMKRIPVVIPPAAEQVAIVRFLNYADRKIQGYIHAKHKLIKLLEEQKQAIIHRAITRGLNLDAPLKLSDVGGAKEIPAHWQIRRAKQLCIAIVDCKNRTPEVVPGGEFVVVRTTNIRGGQFSLVGSYPTDRHNYEIWSERGAPRNGDVFFTREAPAGEACLVPDIPNLCMGQRMMYFRPDPEVLDASFLLYSIYGPVVRSYIEGQSNGSTVGHLRLGQVASLPILWCPVDEQRAIVNHIDSAVKPIAALMDIMKGELRLLQEYRTRLIADVVTGKLDVRLAATRLSDCELPSIVTMEQDLEPLESDGYEADVCFELEEVGV